MRFAALFFACLTACASSTTPSSSLSSGESEAVAGVVLPASSPDTNAQAVEALVGQEFPSWFLGDPAVLNPWGVPPFRFAEGDDGLVTQQEAELGVAIMERAAEEPECASFGNTPARVQHDFSESPDSEIPCLDGILSVVAGPPGSFIVGLRRDAGGRSVIYVVDARRTVPATPRSPRPRATSSERLDPWSP